MKAAIADTREDLISVNDKALDAFLDDQEYDTAASDKEWWELIDPSSDVLASIVSAAFDAGVFGWDKDRFPWLFIHADALDAEAYTCVRVSCLNPDWPTLSSASERARYFFGFAGSQRDRVAEALRRVSDETNAVWRAAHVMGAALNSTPRAEPTPDQSRRGGDGATDDRIIVCKLRAFKAWPEMLPVTSAG